MEPKILQRPDHRVSRKHIGRNALTVLYRLNEKGYKAYLAGGCVRDLMLGFQPKDFDVVTDATPQQVKRCFRNCRLIGRRFRLAHVMFHDDIIEVATFRAPTTPLDPEALSDDGEAPVRNRRDVVIHEDTGVVVRDNEYGTPEEDAFRRDFTINALFYNIEDFSIIDYIGGLEDLEAKVIHCIGDPDLRYKEDPVRMIRALRFAATLDLSIEDNTYQGILRQREQITHASHARMYEEVLKFFYSGAMAKAFELWLETELFDLMFPGLSDWYRERATVADRNWMALALQQLDKWKQNGVKASQELAYTLLLAPFIRSTWIEIEQEQDISSRNACMEAVHQIQRVLVDRILIPKRILFRIFDLVFAQTRFEDRQNPQRVERFTRRPYFRDALVLYKFDAMATQTPRADLIAAWSEDLKNAPPPRERKQRPHSRGRRRRRRA